MLPHATWPALAAGNSVDDIHQLCDYAHRYGVRVYVTVNTLIYEDEIDKAYQLMKQLAEAKVDALLVQDMAAIELVARVRRELGYAPALHASTQCDTRSAGKVRWLQQQGFSRAVLARELSLDEIPWRALCELFRCLLRLAALLRPFGQPGRLCSVLPYEV